MLKNNVNNKLKNIVIIVKMSGHLIDILLETLRNVLKNLI